MDRPSADDRSAVSLAVAWGTRVTAIAAEMVVPGLIGHWIDTKLGVPLVFMLIGFALGITTAIMQLIRITSSNADTKHPSHPSDKNLPQS